MVSLDLWARFSVHTYTHTHADTYTNSIHNTTIHSVFGLNSMTMKSSIEN